MVKIDIIIVNWNAGQQLRECLESIGTTESEGFEISRVVIVDNASSDGSVDGLDDLSLPLTIIRNDINRGFAVACNQGVKGSVADYVLFLNPDTRLFKDSLSKPLAFMEQQDNQQVGIVGIQLVGESGQISRTCARFPTPGSFFTKIMGLDRMFPNFFPSFFMNNWDHGQTKEVDHVMGAFLLTRHCIFETLGGFDERFFVYFEDVDFSLRANECGWKTIYLANTQAYHKGGGTSDKVKASRLFYTLHSRIKYGYKNFGLCSATFLLIATLFLEPLARLILALGRRSGRDALETLEGCWRLWVTLTTHVFRSR